MVTQPEQFAHGKWYIPLTYNILLQWKKAKTSPKTWFQTMQLHSFRENLVSSWYAESWMRERSEYIICDVSQTTCFFPLQWVSFLCRATLSNGIFVHTFDFFVNLKHFVAASQMAASNVGDNDAATLATEFIRPRNRDFQLAILGISLVPRGRDALALQKRRELERRRAADLKASGRYSTHYPCSSDVRPWLERFRLRCFTLFAGPSEKRR